jgi:hypothetical protein
LIVLSMFFVDIHFCDIVLSFWVDANLCRVFLSLVYTCIAVGDLVIKRGGIPLTRFTSPHFCGCPNARTWVGVFSEWRWEVIVCFVDIGGIVDHHCINFLFTTQFLNFFVFNPPYKSYFHKYQMKTLLQMEIIM